MHVREMRQLTVSELDKYIILDTQGGHEDIIGLIAALKLAAQHNRVVIGITCVKGRRSLDSCVQDALIAQQIAGTKVPVFKGCTKSLLLREDFPECVNMSKNFSDLDSFPLDEKLNQVVQKQSAASFISASIKQYKDQLCIITFGPLTNFALAFHLNQCNQSHKQLSSIRINGGSYLGVGDVIGHSGSESNFYFDPEAAHIIVTNYQNIYVNPIQRTMQTSLKQQITDLIEKSTTIKAKEGLYMLLSWLKDRNYSICGPLLTVLPVFNRLISTSIINVYTEVIRSGGESAGMMAPNWLRLEVLENQQIPNTKIYTELDREILVKLLHQAFD